MGPDEKRTASPSTLGLARAQTGETAGDLELVRQVRAGVPGAVDLFVQRMRILDRLAHTMNEQHGARLGTDDLEEIAQEAFRRVWRDLDSFEGRSKVTTWAGRYLVNVFRETSRSRRLQNFEDEEFLPAAEPSELGSSHDVEVLLERIGELEESLRQVVQLRLAGHLFQEVAAELSIPISTAKTRYHRAVKILARTLGENESDLEGNPK